jgi:hypothetical protein
MHQNLGGGFDNQQYQQARGNNMISPRGTIGRLQTKRQQFEQIIQAEKDNNQHILNSMVKPYGRTAKYEDHKQANSAQTRPRYNYSVQMPSNPNQYVGSMASNKGSVAKFEDQKHGHTSNKLDDTFTREEKTMTMSASQPILKNYRTVGRYSNPYDDDDEDFATNLKLMYPEPGLRETFVNGVNFDSHTKHLSPQRAMENNPMYHLGSVYSQRKTGSVAMAKELMDTATRNGNGIMPSYGRIIGLSRRLDKGVSLKLKKDDALKDHQNAVKELVSQEKNNSGFHDMTSKYEQTYSPRQYSQFQKNALNVINR